MKIRVLMAKIGLDGHDRGARLIASVLRDAGMEVIYTGIRQTPEAIARIALEEDVDVVGVSCLTGGHMVLFPLLIKELKKNGMGDVIVVVGGVIPQDDYDFLRKLGVAAIFGPGTFTKEIIDFINKAVAEKGRKKLAKR